VYPQSSGRRIGPAFVALLTVLAVVAGTGGYLAARQVLAGQPAAGPGPSGTTTSDTRSPSATAAPGRSPDPGDSGTLCPELTSKAVAGKGLDGNLTLVLYIAFHPATGSGEGGELWVCRNGTGQLIYQGHVTSGPMLSADSSNTLLLADGIKGTVVASDGGFLAVNPSADTKTEYHVSRTQLKIVLPSGREQLYLVDRVVLGP
jgi:hypothetical protein